MQFDLNKAFHPLLAAVFLLAGCEETLHTDFPVSAEDQAAVLSDNVHIIRLTPENISQYRNS